MFGTGLMRPLTRSQDEGSGSITPVAPRASRRASFPHAADHRAGSGRLPSVSDVQRAVRHKGLVILSGAEARFKSP